MPPTILKNHFVRQVGSGAGVFFLLLTSSMFTVWNSSSGGIKAITVFVVGLSLTLIVRGASAGYIRFDKDTMTIRAFFVTRTVGYNDIAHVVRRNVQFGLRAGEAPVIVLKSGKRIALGEWTASNSTWKVWKKDYRLVDAVEKEIAARIVAIGDTVEGGNL